MMSNNCTTKPSATPRASSARIEWKLVHCHRKSRSLRRAYDKYECRFTFMAVLACSSTGELAIFALDSFWKVLVPSHALAAPEEACRTSSGERFQLPSRLIRRCPD